MVERKKPVFRRPEPSKPETVEVSAEVSKTEDVAVEAEVTKPQEPKVHTATMKKPRN